MMLIALVYWSRTEQLNLLQHIHAQLEPGLYTRGGTDVIILPFYQIC